MPGARCTRGLVCKIVQRNAHEHTGSAEAIRHSLRDGLRLIRALLGVPGFLATVACRSRRAGPVRADIAHPADLITASGDPDHTTSSVRSQHARQSRRHVHHIPLPTSVTIAIRPSCGGRTREDNHIFLKNGSKIFRRWRWIMPTGPDWLTKSAFWRGDFASLDAAGGRHRARKRELIRRGPGEVEEAE